MRVNTENGKTTYTLSGKEFREHPDVAKLRDTFAGLAMQAFLGVRKYRISPELPAEAYKVADEMLEARNKTEE